MYGAANVGSLMRSSHHTKKPLPALGNPPPPPNAVPAGKLGEADHGPSNSASAIDSIEMHRDEQPANRGDPTSPPTVQLIWPLTSIPGVLASLRPSIMSGRLAWMATPSPVGDD